MARQENNMKKIGKTIIEKDIENFDFQKERETVRAVIFNDEKICMLYSGLYNDYTFPGGGLKEGESHLDALKRELKEELGANLVKIIKPIGFTEEIRYGLNKNESIYKQTSYYYLCEVSQLSEPIFIGREKEQRLKFTCLSLNEAISQNEITNSKRDIKNHKGFTTVLRRENLILKYLKEKII